MQILQPFRNFALQRVENCRRRRSYRINRICCAPLHRRWCSKPLYMKSISRQLTADTQRIKIRY